MHEIDLPVLRNNQLARYRYLVGPYNIGIITPLRNKHIVTIPVVRAAWKGAPIEVRSNGMHDQRVTPEEIANYIIRNGIK